ncbi:MAG TPA: nitrile hydratase subunit beta [Stellaceae bacterium]|nr:nitrile hydratase subunit beta [Stellaceae bacterium]
MSNTIHDMGGMQGFGPVLSEPHEPPFHAAWEGRVYAMQRALGYSGLWTIDGGRASLETLPPLEYLAASYYERWFLGLEKRVVAHGLVGRDEIAAGRSLRPGLRLNRKMTAADARRLPLPNYERAAAAPPLFKPGDVVCTRNLNPATHTRLPRYARGRRGTVEAVRGCHVYPDSAALDPGNEHPQWLYTVVFSGRELWGDDADPAIRVSIEAFEPYLTAT